MPVATIGKRGRKRHDPDSSAPVDGVYRPDLVINKRPGMRYYWLNAEDAAHKRALGATKVPRTEDGPQMKFDTGDKSAPDIEYRGLTLYEMPEKLARKYDDHVVAEGKSMMRGLKQQDRAAGLSEAPNVWEN
jgi:hypothetical protein